jgi:acetyl-CoA decarbonylase/synthase complex subunit delta
MPLDRLIVDPTTGGLGYGLEYSYSVMERLRMAAMAQGDDKLQYPIINNLGNEVWKCKEAKQTAKEAPALGDPEKRGILMEAIGAVTYLMAGSDILIMRHPEAIRMVRAYIDLLIGGGMATKVAPIAKKLDDADIDYAAISPKPDLKIEEEKKAAPKKEAPQKAAPKKAAPKKAAPKKVAVKADEPRVEAAPAPAPEADAAAKAKAAAEAKVKAEMDVKAKADAEAKAKAETEAKARADAEAKTKAEAEAKNKADKEAAAKRLEEENVLRLKRAEEREKHAAERSKKEKGKVVAMTAAAEQKTQNEKILETLNRIHRRIPLY